MLLSSFIKEEIENIKQGLSPDLPNETSGQTTMLIVKIKSRGTSVLSQHI